MPDSVPPPLDLERLRSVVGGDHDFEKALLEQFMKETHARLHRMAEYAGRGEHEKVAREAHTLNGSAKNIGAAPLGEMGRELQQKAQEESASLLDYTQHLARMEQEYQRLEDYLSSWR